MPLFSLANNSSLSSQSRPAIIDYILMQIQAPNYKKIALLGRGSSGKAYLVENSQRERFVVKKITIQHLNRQQQLDVLKQASIMSELYHPNIISLREVGLVNGKVCISMQFADGGTIQQLINERQKGLNQNQIICIAIQLGFAVRHIHQKKIIHRDIKAQNIFITKEGIIKLGDFGISKVLEGTSDLAKTFIGTPKYLSPEIVEGQPYSYKSDMWAFGVLLYELCTLKCPFDGTSLPMLAIRIMRGVYQPINDSYSQQLKNLIYKLLNPVAEQRPSADQLLDSSILQSFYKQKEKQKKQQFGKDEGHCQSARIKSNEQIPRVQQQKPKMQQKRNILIQQRPQSSQQIQPENSSKQQKRQSVCFTIQFKPQKAKPKQSKKSVQRVSNAPSKSKPPKSKEEKKQEREQLRRQMIQDIKSKRGHHSAVTDKAAVLTQADKLAIKPDNKFVRQVEKTKIIQTAKTAVKQKQKSPMPPKQPQKQIEVKQQKKVESMHDQLSKLNKMFKDFKNFDDIIKDQPLQRQVLDDIQQDSLTYITSGITSSELKQMLAAKIPDLEKVLIGVRKWIEGRSKLEKHQFQKQFQGKQWSDMGGQLIALCMLQNEK